MKTSATFLALMLFTTLALRAQVVADGATNTLSSVTNSFTGDVTVGTNGSFTLLILSNNALLTNSVRGVIGHNPTAKSNEVRLVSPSARWLMGNNLLVGSNGAMSRLVISNGARVENFDGILANSIASSNNVALVTGSGSTWSNRGDLAVGFSGRENQLIVSNGGFVFNRFGYLGRQPGSSNNIARVSGSGSVWTNQFYLTVGGNDRGNRLIVEAGGLVTCSDGIVSGSSSAGNNEVLVTGPGSLWRNRFFLFLGDVAGRNRLVVSNGATVWSGGGILGNLSPAFSNHVIVTGGGSVWTNESSLSLGEGSSGNRVEVSDGGQLAGADGYIGLNAGANNNTVLLTGVGSAWNSLASLTVGNSGSGNVLIASNGAAVFVGDDGGIGINATASSNTVLVTDPGTRWQLVNHLYVGSNGPFNRLVISNGATVFNAHLSYLGFSSGANSNIAIVTGPGSAWTNMDYFFIGQGGAGNQLIVSNGAKVRAGSGFAGIGLNSSASNNAALVTGSNSLWQINGRLDLGRYGRNNQLTIANGGTVANSDFTLLGFDSSANQLLVTGTNSVFQSSGDVSVGQGGSGNRLVVTNGGMVLASARVIVGESNSSSSNRVVVDAGTLLVTNAAGTGLLDVRRGTNLFNAGLIEVDQLMLTNPLGKFEFNGGVLITRGTLVSNNAAFNVGSSGGTPAVWDVRAGATNHFVSGSLVVGEGSAFNQLLLTNGASLRNNNGYLGFNLGSSSNLAVISGSGSVWSNASLLIIGNASQGNRLVVSNGAAVRDSSGYVGLDSIGNNLAVVTGPGSLWTNSSDLFVGTFGAGNRLVVSAGGVVKNNNGFVGIDATANNNLVLVHGSGSVWSNTLELYVGYSASRNQLVVSNGGSLFTVANSFIGFNSTAVSNTALVTGAGSRWLLSSNLYLGTNGAFNTLVVSNGGQVLNRLGELGTLAGIASNNLAVVTDPGSVWSNTVQLIVGRFSSGNQLQVINGGRVESDSCIFGANFSSSNSSALVSGPGSALNVGTSFTVGSASIGNRLVISNGAAVRANNGFIGFSGTSSNNEALVTGLASTWSNAVSLFVGNSGQASRLIVTNGGVVVAGNRISLGEFNSSTNNRVIVDGGTLRATNPSGNAILEIRRGTNLFNAGLMDVDQLLMTNTLGKFEFNGGTLITRGAFIRNGDNFFMGAAGTNRAVWDVRAGVSNTYINDTIRVGSGSSFNQLILTNGNVLTNSESADLGTSFGANSNSAVIAGPGSQWLLGDGIIVGRAGSGNRLVASNGAALVTASISYLGFQSASSNNEAEVTGPGTSWNSGSIYGLTVGYQGHHNRLRITDGALVTSGLSVIGEFATSSNNLVVVAGAGSLWTNSGEMNVGYAGNGNQLVVSNSAVLADSGHGFIGRNSGANSNSVIVTDPGTRWLIASNLFVGSNGALSLLVISNTARVVNSNAFVGFNGSSSNNAALISGGGSVWSNRQTLVVGQSGSGNRVVISNGARLDNRFCTLGANASASNNVLVVTGPGSAWVIEQSFTLGNFGGGNQLVITNGGRVRGSGTIGGFSANNEVIVTGVGSTWTNGSNLNVGSVGSGNRLIIRDGGEVVEQPFDVILGVSSSSTNNRVVVDGGALRIVNSFSALDVRRGTNVLNAGLIDTGRLLVTNALGQFEFNGGTLVTSETAISNGRGFTVGNGTSPATFELRSGTHSFANNLVVANNASLIGNGTIAGVLTVQTGGSLSPGTSVGKIALSNSPSLQGLVRMEIAKNGSTRTNDQLQVSGSLTYGGSLVVTNLGPDPLALGDRFPLFAASNYSGAFTNITLPVLPVTLAWTNQLLVDGSLEVVAYVPPLVELTIQNSNGVLRVSWPTNGADYCLETSYDLAPPVSWQTVSGGISTNGASFVFTLPNLTAAPKRFFRLAFPCSPVPLTLSLQYSNNLVVVSWPSNAFRLETSFNLLPPVAWQTISNGITETGAARTFTFTNSPAVPKQFFRLAFP